MAYLTGGRGHCVPSKLNTLSGVICSIVFLTIIAIQIWCAAVMRSTGRCIPSVNVKSLDDEHGMANTKLFPILILQTTL